MSPAGDARRRRRRKIIGASAAAVMLATAALTTTVNYWPGADSTLSGSALFRRLWLLATRDLDTTTPCDIPAGGPSDNKPLVADQTWTRTGGQSCFPVSLNAAQCFAATEIPYTSIDASGIGWAVEPDSVNRITYNTAIDCTNWTCTGTASATPLQAAPDGSATASLVTTNGLGSAVYQSGVTGYANSVTLYPRSWIKCSSGTLYLRHPSGSTYGYWSVDCSSVSGGSWALVHSASQTGVTEITAWSSTAAGGGSIIYYMATTGSAYIWAPTLTEEPGTGLSVIPTAAAAVSTGDPAWVIDNSTSRYWKTGDTVTQTLSQISGTCWDTTDATQLYLTGYPGSECAGIWYGLEVSR